MAAFFREVAGAVDVVAVAIDEVAATIDYITPIIHEVILAFG